MDGLNIIFDGVQTLNSVHSFGVISWLLACVFLWSGSAKLKKPMLTALIFVDFGLLTQPSQLMAYVLSCSEIILGCLLALRVFPTITLIVSAILLFSFVLIIANSLQIGNEFACYCFGSDESLSYLTLLRTSLLLGLSVIALLLPHQPLWLDSNSTVLEFVIAIALLMSTLIAFRTKRLLNNVFAPMREESIT